MAVNAWPIDCVIWIMLFAVSFARELNVINCKPNNEFCLTSVTQWWLTSCLADVTFAEFVRFVIDSWHEGEELDRHWSPQFRLCQPCQIRYDFMGHYETLYDDADAVLVWLNTGVKPQDVAVSHFPRADPDNKRVGGSSEAMRKLYSSVSRNDIRELYSLYAPDYELFGYSHPYDLWKNTSNK